MFILKKLFQLRDHTNPSAEKPFLEHLEDLRVCITRIVVTLLLSTVLCFVFRNELMEIIRQPIKEVWERGEEKSLKESRIPLQDWEDAKQRTDAYNDLLPQDRADYLQQFDEPDKALEAIRMVAIYRAALTFKEKEAQKKYIGQLASVEAAMKEKILALLDGAPNAQTDARGKLVRMQALKPTEGFMLSIKLAFFAGIVIAFPFLLLFLLQFIVPGMHDNERRALWPAMVIGFGLFLGGIFFSYFIVLPKVLEFFHAYSEGMQIENEWRIGYYIAFATQFTLIFGLSFELPVLVMTLVRIGILNCEMMRNTRAYAILAIFVVAAIITPTPDAFTLCLLAGPMVILYEICIWLSYFLDKKQARREAEEEQQRLAKLLALKERRAALNEDDEDHGDDDHDPDPPGPADPHGPPDPYHPDPNADSTPYHDPHHHGHAQDHDQDQDHYDYHTEHAAFHAEHDAALGYGDDGHTGAKDHSDSEAPGESAPPSPTPALSSPGLAQEAFDFHEEVDPGLTEEGEQEDISDPWPEEDEETGDTGDDTPEEERYRERDDPHGRDRD